MIAYVFVRQSAERIWAFTMKIYAAPGGLQSTIDRLLNGYKAAGLDDTKLLAWCEAGSPIAEKAVQLGPRAASEWLRGLGQGIYDGVARHHGGVVANYQLAVERAREAMQLQLGLLPMCDPSAWRDDKAISERKLKADWACDEAVYRGQPESKAPLHPLQRMNEGPSQWGQTVQRWGGAMKENPQ